MHILIAENLKIGHLPGLFGHNEHRADLFFCKIEDLCMWLYFCDCRQVIQLS